MTNPPEANEFQTKLRRLELLVQQAERLADPEARIHARNVVQALLDLHGMGLERLLDCVTSGPAGNEILDACATDEVVAGLLLLHGLHPLDAEDRVRQVLEEIEPYLQSHGVEVTLIDVNNCVVRLHLESNCNGCPSSTASFRQKLEEAIYAKAPDITAVEIEGLEVIPDGAKRIALTVL
jgi:Fe-S cluster biogenesis protein NfuA